MGPSRGDTRKYTNACTEPAPYSTQAKVYPSRMAARLVVTCAAAAGGRSKDSGAPAAVVPARVASDMVAKGVACRAGKDVVRMGEWKMLNGCVEGAMKSAKRVADSFEAHGRRDDERRLAARRASENTARA
jgi:hypothetical protein